MSKSYKVVCAIIRSYVTFCNITYRVGQKLRNEIRYHAAKRWLKPSSLVTYYSCNIQGRRLTFTVGHSKIKQGDQLTCCQQQLSAKVLKLSFEYFHIYSSKSDDFAEKQQNCIINALSKVRFTQNIEMKLKPRFRGYSMNTLNIYTDAALTAPSTSGVVRWSTSSSNDECE